MRAWSLTPTEDDSSLPPAARGESLLGESITLLQVNFYAVVVWFAQVDNKNFLRGDFIDSHELAALIARGVEIRLPFGLVIEPARKEHGGTISNIIGGGQLPGGRAQLHAVALTRGAGRIINRDCHVRLNSYVFGVACVTAGNKEELETAAWIGGEIHRAYPRMIAVARRKRQELIRRHHVCETFL